MREALTKGATTRARKISFIEGFGTRALTEAVAAAFQHHGTDWLTDEQLEEITSRQLADFRSTARRHRHNRAILKERANG
ncbi:hypothetical protein [Roseibium suaedae]|uniref:Uncharacterized protein n=1 Tax=Roseibium suaedae TaxID=735517 RepID=A0A1M7D5Y3_9HYPH|nr:hypothetical protein [Roseibium suaedae]SHL74922.1 hypothetical protein SAMN05444272_1383 [Roseibium suaedae]